MLAVTLLVALCSYLYFARNSRKKVKAAIAEQNNCKPVAPFVPYKWPLALDLLKRQYEILFGQHTFEDLTPYFGIAGTCCIHLFGQTGYFMTDPENVEAILSTRVEDYGLGSRRLAGLPLLGEGVFEQDGTAWKPSQELIRCQLVRVQKQTPQVFTPHVKELVADIASIAVDGRVDLKPLMYEYTLNTTTMLLFSEPHSRMPKEERDAVRDNFDYAAFGCGIRVRLADLAWLYSPTKFKKACRDVREWTIFFVTKVIKYKDEFGKEAAAENFHLVRNRNVLERLQREIASVQIDHDITREEVQRLPFLRCCLNETLRLCPTLPLSLRFANKPTILPRGGGPDGNIPVLLPKGSGIAYSVYHLHRLESIYGPDAKVYRPQRWESGELMKSARPGAGYVDFNGGPRLCLGKDFALMEASYAVIRVIQAYPNIRLTPGIPNEPVAVERQTYTIGLSPADGVLVALT